VQVNEWWLCSALKNGSKGPAPGTPVPLAPILANIFNWLAERKHRAVYASVCKPQYKQNYALQKIPDELNTIWRFLGFHVILAMQRCCQPEEKTKGILFFRRQRKTRRIAVHRYY
jgi:hypothetical protein